jgi:Sigma-70 region 2
VLPHLDSAANLARWMLRNRTDSDDVVQEATLRAYRFFGQFHGGDAGAWLAADPSKYLLHLAAQESTLGIEDRVR